MHKVDNGGDMGEMFHITQKVMISDKIKWRLRKFYDRLTFKKILKMWGISCFLYQDLIFFVSMNNPGSNLHCDTKIAPKEWIVVEIYGCLPKRPYNTEYVMMCDKIKRRLRKIHTSDTRSARPYPT